jgi:hypothetical protein
MAVYYYNKSEYNKVIKYYFKAMSKNGNPYLEKLSVAITLTTAWNIHLKNIIPK